MKEKIMSKKEKNLKYFTLFFLFFIPLFSTTFFHNRLTTLFQVLIISIIFLLTIIIYPTSRKNLKYLFLYLLLCFIYLLINYFRANSFYSLIPGNFNYSIFSEVLTIIKLVMPMIFIYSLYYQKIPKKDYFLIVNIWVYMITLSIVITNIFKLGYSTYGGDTLACNIFEWGSDIHYSLTASKGYFMYANQQSAIMLMLLLISVYEFLYEKKRYIINVILLMFAMLMLGTRVSSLGGLLTLACAIIFYIILTIYNKKEIQTSFLWLVVVVLAWTMILPISPFANRSVELQNNPDIYIEEDIPEDATAIEDLFENNSNHTNDKVSYVYENYNPGYLPESFFQEYYPVNYDPDFWYDFLVTHDNINFSFRDIEKGIIKRVIEINDNKLDILFGISNTRIQNIVNIESDFILHYYAFGIIGSIILLFIYLVLVVIGLKNFFTNPTYFNFSIITSILLFIFAAFLSGNIINSLNIILPFSFLSSGLFFSKKG